MSATTEHPKVFISYSWTSVGHQEFVVEFAKALVSHGVDVILDKWALKPGQDKYVFMESMVVNPEVVKVLVFCDRKYQEKANARVGGVGTESQIISQELYGKVTQTKFIPLVCEYDDDGQACLPVFMRGLLYVDVSTDERYGEGLDEILRIIYDQPFYQKPKLGSAPAFVSDGGTSQVRELQAALRAIRDGKSNRQGLEGLFIKGVLAELDNLYVTPEGNDYHEGVYKAISGTKGLRDQVAEYFDTVAAFSQDDIGSVAPFIKMMEGLGAHFGPPQSGSYYPGWTDFYAFFALESMLIQTAALLRHERWKSLRRVLEAVYVIRDRQGKMTSETFLAFDRHFVSLDEHRNRGLELNRVSVSADVMRERCAPDRTSFNEMMQADVFLALKGVVSFSDSVDGRRRYWAPKTTIFSSYGNKLPLFLHAADSTVREGIFTAIGVQSGRELKERVERARSVTESVQLASARAFGHFDFFEAINFTVLAK